LASGLNQQVSIDSFTIQDCCRIIVVPVYIDSPPTGSVQIPENDIPSYMGVAGIYDSGWITPTSSELEPNFSDWFSSHGLDIPDVKTNIVSPYLVNQIVDAPPGHMVTGFSIYTFVFGGYSGCSNYNMTATTVNKPAGV
jgi:hypothetical protein